MKVSEGKLGPLLPRGQRCRLPGKVEAQINSTHRDLNRTGSLYKSGEGAVPHTVTTTPSQNTWFTLEVETVGNHIRVWVKAGLTAGG